MTTRNPETIKNEIAAAKAIFDRRVFRGQFYSSLSRKSLQHQWVILNRAVAPLCAELAQAEANERAEALRDEIRRDVQAYMQLRRTKKGRAA